MHAVLWRVVSPHWSVGLHSSACVVSGIPDFVLLLGSHVISSQTGACGEHPEDRIDSSNFRNP